jgi:hypothetical protein
MNKIDFIHPFFYFPRVEQLNDNGDLFAYFSALIFSLTLTPLRRL